MNRVSLSSPRSQLDWNRADSVVRLALAKKVDSLLWPTKRLSRVQPGAHLSIHNLIGFLHRGQMGVPPPNAASCSCSCSCSSCCPRQNSFGLKRGVGVGRRANQSHFHAPFLSLLLYVHCVRRFLPVNRLPRFSCSLLSSSIFFVLFRSNRIYAQVSSY